MRRITMLVAASLLAGCGSPPHDNPYDPATPLAQQARARVTGQVALEPAGAVAPALNGVHVSIPGTSMAADTDAAGAFAISGVPAGTWSLQAVKAGWVDGYLGGITVTLAQGGHDVVVPTLTLGVARGSVLGRVSFDDGMGNFDVPLAGASVSLTGRPGAVSSDAAGQYLISDVPVGTYTLQVTREGFQQATSSSFPVVQGLVAAAPDLPMAWNPGGVAGGLTVQGAPDAGGVTVRVSGVTVAGTPFEATTTSAPDGHYGLVGLVPAGTYNVSFELRDYGTAATAAVVAPGATTLLPTLGLIRDTGGVMGTATLEGSGNSSGIQVTLTPLPTAGNPTPSPAGAAVTDSSGAWRVDALPVGSYRVAYAPPAGYLAPATATVVVVASAVVIAEAVVATVNPGTLRGTVLLEGAAAGSHAGTLVQVEGTVLSTHTLANGSWVMTGVGTGPQTVACSAAGFDTQRVQVATLPGGDLTLAQVTLPVSRGAIQGVFTLAGLPVSAGVVVSASGPGSGSAITDGAGAFRLSSLPVGSYAVTARRDPDWQPITVTGVVVTAGGLVTVTGSPLSLQPVSTASLAGRVLLQRPADATGTTVTVTGVDLRGSAVNRTAMTGTTGDWSVTGLLAGSYQVACAHLGYDAPGASGASVASGQAISLGTVTLLVSRGSVAGTVTLSAGAVTGFPVGSDRSGVVVTLSGVDVPVPSAVTDVSGSYRFDDVPVSLAGGSYGVTARRTSYLSAATSVTALAGATATAPGLTLPLNAGSLGGTVQLWDNVAGGGANASSAGASVSATGVAFNGAAWSAAGVSAANGIFSLPNLPPGSFDLIISSAGRTCGALARTAVQEGTAASAGSAQCIDALPPSGVTLGAPPAYVATTSVTVPIAAAATDPTLPGSNFRGYQLAVGAAPSWTSATLVAGQPASLAFTGLPRNGRSFLWVRAVDWAGNAGTAASVEVVEDDLAPAAPVISTPRSVVDATTTSVTLSGSEADANFGGYELCTATQAATVACAASAPGGCAWGGTSPSFALSLTANQRTCLYARAFDLAGTRSAVSSLGVGGVVSDLTPPTPPGFVPSFDPVLLTVRAPWVDFFLATASTDAPAGSGDWGQVAWVEVDTGAGYAPLCPAAACHAGGTYAPCAAGCGCTDSRLRCDGTRFAGVRVPLLEGSANDVAFRAVDLAGNVGSGVSQQVRADSASDVLGGTVAIDGNPVMRGNLVTFDSWVPGAGNPHGVIVDLGSDHRAQASDPRCDLAGYVSSGYARGIVPAGPTLVLLADSTAKMIRAGTPGGPTGAFCAADAVTTTFRTAPANYYVRGVSGAGEVGAWWEDYYSAAIANVYVRHPGADGTFGNGDDVTTLLATFNYVDSITLADRALLVHYSSCGAGCYTDAWRVYNANSSGGYSSGVTVVTLPITTPAAISQDGRWLAWTAAGPTLVVRGSGANGLFDGIDDTTTSLAIPSAWGIYDISSTIRDGPIAVDGTHVVMLGTTATLGWVIHWWAGPDGAWGTADDTVERFHPTAETWGTAWLASSYAAFGDGNDIRAVDLSTLRWEVTPPAGLSLLAKTSLAVDGGGTLLYLGKDYVLHARSPAGRETSIAGIYGEFDVLGTTLLMGQSNSLVLRAPDGSGSWFSAGAPAPVTLFTGGASGFFSRVALGGGKGIAVEYLSGGNVRFRILEPRAGTLATLPTTGAVVDPLGVDQPLGDAAGITGRQAFYTCGGASLNLCVRNAGADGYFGTIDDTSSNLLHPTGSSRVGLAVHDARAFLVSGTRMVLAEFSPAALYLFDAGPDGLFGNADDRGRKLADGYFAQEDMALAGDYTAYLAEGSPVGTQVYLVRGLDGAATKVTSHFSAKRSVHLEPSGRLFWVDAVLVPSAVFVRTP